MKTVLAWIAAVLAAITGILAFFGKTPADALGWIRSACASIWHFLMGTISIPVWALILLSIPCFVCIIWIILRMITQNRNQTWRDYTQDNFFGLVWRWSWGRGLYGLNAYCPTCDVALTCRDDYEYDNVGNRKSITCFNCTECDSAKLMDGSSHDLIHRVERLIDKNVRNDSWKKQHAQ